MGGTPGTPATTSWRVANVVVPQEDWQPRAARLLDLVMNGLRAGAPGH
nr:hypothetical protein [Streptomyces sp. FT05W]